jgi:ubiquitin C-terminal hydrolase
MSRKNRDEYNLLQFMSGRIFLIKNIATMFSRGKKNSLVSLLIFNLKENLRFIIHERFSFSKYDKINIVQHEGLIN